MSDKFNCYHDGLRHRQESLPCCRPSNRRRDRAAAEVVAPPPLPDRGGPTEPIEGGWNRSGWSSSNSRWMDTPFQLRLADQSP